MRTSVQLLGYVLGLQGIIGILSDLGIRTWNGLSVVEHVSVLRGYEIFTNAVLVVIGAALVIATLRLRGSADEDGSEQRP
ncbi:hypothetical protein [Actinopolymorpha pittospori]